MHKPKLMWYSESSLLSSGYGVYSWNILHELHKLGKYEIAEIATYLRPDHPRISELPWQVFPVMPVDEELLKEYHSRPSFQFGEFVLDACALKFKPNYVCSIRDEWADSYLHISPAKPFFKHIHCPTVDSTPQKREWLYTYGAADKLLAYSDWGMEQLKNEGAGNLNTTHAAFSGVDTDIFKPLDRTECRRSLGIPENAFVVSTVMRAQIRKLYFDLLQSFAKFLEIAPPPIAKNSYLYVHCRYPDISWDFKSLLQELGVGHRVFFSYVCEKCRAVFSSLFKGAKAHCVACGSHKCYMPGLLNGISPNCLSRVFNISDIYVQYANCEGFGMSQVEAAACGVPVMSIDFSAMSDICRKIGGIPIPVKRTFRDVGVDADRALPDNDAFVKLLIEYARLPKEIRLKYENVARESVLQFFTWKHVAQRWVDVIDNTPFEDNWNAPPNIHEFPKEVPPNLTDAEFVRWGFNCVSGRPDLNSSQFSLRFQRDLANGYDADGKPVDRNTFLPQFESLGNTKNIFERKRCNLI